MATLSPIQLARFWSRIRPAPDFHCWEWQGQKTPNGYGRFGGKMAHRLAHELVNGPIPSGSVVRHKCDNPPCCNPRHLVAGTQAQNMQDMAKRGRHLAGQKNSRAKLTEDQALEILRNPERLGVRQLASKMGVSPSTVSLVRSGKRWAHLAR